MRFWFILATKMPFVIIYLLFFSEEFNTKTVKTRKDIEKMKKIDKTKDLVSNFVDGLRFFSYIENFD